MKVLLVHPDDSVEVGPWADTKWNLIVDLGWSGRHSYSQQAERFGCEVLSIYDLLDHEEHRLQLRDLLAVGLNHLVDSQSVDWWDAFSALHYQQIEQLMLAEILARRLSQYAQIFATRGHSSHGVLALLLGRKIQVYEPGRKTGFEIDGQRYWKRIFALRPSQMAEIALDKWDTGYQLRRHVRRRPPASGTPAVLLPSAYGNVSRAQLAYARMLTQRRFLLVVTRRSGRRHLQLPSNVEVRSLAGYAPSYSPSTERERIHLLGKWQELQQKHFAQSSVLKWATQLRMFAGFPNFLKSGLRIRDAWRQVLANEPISAVLSADEHNPFTRLPIVLARAQRLSTVFCDHGALNMSFGIRPACSDMYLASGDMARDYMTAWCGLSAEKVIIGGAQRAPGSRQTAANQSSTQQASARQSRDRIVFFSEQYELSSSRTQTLYSELLPELCSLARHTNRRVIVKLHPFESFRARKAMIDHTLSEKDRVLVDMREGPMTSDLFERAWFTVTVESSAAVESTTNGVPCFLCRWFDVSWYDYAKQFEKYSAGYWLDSPRSVGQIPLLLKEFAITDETQRSLHTAIAPEHLDSILFGS